MKKMSSTLYTVFISLCLFFHVYNDIAVTESIKLFHVFAILAVIFGFPLMKQKGVLQKKVLYLIACILVSSVLSYYSNSIFLGIGVVVIMLSVVGLQKVDVRRLLIINNLLAPIVIISLLYLNFTQPTYRFCGYYNDPNYLCTTLLVYLYIIILGFRKFGNRILKVFMVAEMLAIFVLVSFTLSRTGMLCTVLVLTTAFASFFIKSKTDTIVIALALVAFVAYNIPRILNDQMDLLEERIFERGDNAENAAKYRSELSMRGIKYVANHPHRIPFGIGLGALAHNECLPDFDSRDKHGDHNTFTAYFTELGLSSFLFLLSLISNMLLLIFRRRHFPFGQLRLVTLVIFIFFSLSINQTQYLPFWWLLFFLINFTNDENSTRSLLRPVR